MAEKGRGSVHARCTQHWGAKLLMHLIGKFLGCAIQDKNRFAPGTLAHRMQAILLPFDWGKGDRLEKCPPEAPAWKRMRFQKEPQCYVSMEEPGNVQILF
jgi:hypothetical protein